MIRFTKTNMTLPTTNLCKAVNKIYICFFYLHLIATKTAVIVVCNLQSVGLCTLGAAGESRLLFHVESACGGSIWIDTVAGSRRVLGQI